MDGDHHASGDVLCEGYRLDMRVDDLPLPCPIGAHALMSPDEATFPPVRPLDILSQGGQRAVDVSSIERSISRRQQLAHHLILLRPLLCTTWPLTNHVRSAMPLNSVRRCWRLRE